jgi:MarR family transcriptional regulator, organic hydroperoxide resistance regulator
MKGTQGGYLISKIHQTSDRVFNRLLKEAGIEEINPAQGRILFALWKRDDIPITELAKETLLHKSTLTKMLDNLEASGHIRRRYPPENRRTVYIQLTDENRRLKAKYEAVSEKMRNIYYRGFTGKEVGQLGDLLERVLENLVDEAGSEE